MHFEVFEAEMRQAPRLFTERHAHILYGLIKWIRPQYVVETGSWKGFTAAWMARGLQDSGNPDSLLFCIDDYSFETASAVEISNLLAHLDLSKYVRLISGNSKDESLWPGRVDMAYIDGDHSLEGVKSDCRLAIARGAQCLVLHDTYNWWGPRQVLDWLQAEDFGIIEVGFDQGLAVAMKKFKKGPELYTEKEYPSGNIYDNVQHSHRLAS